MKTVNRGKLFRLVKAGKIQARCKYRYTDDYKWDNDTNFGKTNWMPARISQPYHTDWKQGFINFMENDFKTKSGRAWQESDGTITMIIHSNESYALRIIK